MNEELDLFDELIGIHSVELDSEIINTPKEFLQKFFLYKQPKTFFRTGNLQCASNISRGFFDLYYLTKSTIQNISMDEVAEILLDLVIDKQIVVYFSEEVDKIVFSAIFHRDIMRERLINFEAVYGVDNLSFLDILSMGNKNLKEIIDSI